MAKLKWLLFAVLALKQLTGYTQTTSKDSLTLLDEHRIWNTVVQEYDNCIEENAVLVDVVNVCQQQQQEAVNEADNLKALVANCECDNEVLKLDVANRDEKIAVKDKVIKNNKGKATRKTVGWTAGGVGFGVLLTMGVFLLAK